MKHKEIMREKKKTWKLEIHSMKGSSKKAIKINVELRLNVEEQQDDITFKVKSYIYYSDEV